MIAEMGGLAERLIGDSVDALNRRDFDAGAAASSREDAKIDMLQREIEEKAILTIARRQPMAVDLRDVVGALRVSNDLERIGDLAKNIAKRVEVLDSEFNLQKVMRGVEHMTELVLTQIKDVLDSYARRDVAKALAGLARRRGGRRRQQLAVSRTAHLHDGRSAQHQRLHPSAVLSPRTSSGWAITPPTSPRPSTTWWRVARLPDERPKGDTTSTTNVPYRVDR